MKYASAVLLSIALAAPTLAAADSYTVDARHTFPVFEINHLGFSTQRGRFNKTSGKIVLDMAAKRGSIDITIDTASIDMGLEDWDKHMRNADFFDVEAHPSMTFKSDRVVFEGDKPVAAHGTLTLLGVGQPVKLDIANFRCGVHPFNKRPLCGADVGTQIKRSAFGMTRNLPAVGDVVRILIPVEAFRD